MAASPSDSARGFQLVLNLVVLSLMIGALGLPLNHLFTYSLLVIAVAVLAVGRVTVRPGRWTAAVLIVIAAVGAKFVIDAPRIEEGHNAFLPGGANNALAESLPPPVYRAMAAEFDRAFPPAVRCQPKTQWCWQDSERPKRVYAFSFDGIYDKPAYSRRVTGIDFSDAEWQRLGFVNEFTYNWNTESKEDVSRGKRRRGMARLLHP